MLKIMESVKKNSAKMVSGEERAGEKNENRKRNIIAMAIKKVKSGGSMVCISH